MLIFVIAGVIIALLTFAFNMYVLIQDSFTGLAWRFTKILCALLFMWVLCFLSYMEYGGLFD